MANNDLPTVRVSVMGGESTTFDHQPGRTVGEWLQDAGVNLGKSQSVTVNGEPARETDRVETGAIVTVASKISNG